MKALQGQLIFLLIIISLGVLGSVLVSLGVMLTLIVLAGSFITYWPSAGIDWIIAKVFKKG